MSTCVFHGCITMAWMVTAMIFLSVLKAADTFNIEPTAWKTLSDAAAGFGHKVVQRRSDLLVSAPLAQYSDTGRGKIFKCSTGSCSELPAPFLESAVNTSLGLTMTHDPTTRKTLVCGPTIPKDCKSITMYNGICYEIDRADTFTGPVPSSLQDCRIQADIAFLLDGSGSVYRTDFTRMKNFVKEIIKSFQGKDVKFAIAQFSTTTTIHYYFNTLDPNNWQRQIDGIKQFNRATNTATAINRVVRNVFTTAGGSRPNVRKVLIVITDGESNEPDDLAGAASSAEQKHIVRFAIGVGNAFSKLSAKQELNTIASFPPANYVFQVGGFDALDKIRENLQDKIFAIEGSKTGGETLKMEMSQEGFSAAYVPGGMQLAVVGANQWKGGYQEYSSSRRLQKSFLPSDIIEPDSYLGYSMAVASTPSGAITILGAPRYKHRGIVIAYSNVIQKIDPSQYQVQSGEYFGAEVCAMDVDGDRYTDLVLISAPMYVDTDTEGRVYVCSITGWSIDCYFESPLILRGEASEQARFGHSLAVLPDLNTDGFSDLAVGAPLENNGEGSIYIFHGEGGKRISSVYAQRITAAETKKSLRFFGMSISQSSGDLSMDSLPDLAVGSKGKVVVLRSKPIVMVEAVVTFSPSKISSQTDCTQPLTNTARICFHMTKNSQVTTAIGAKINFTLTLDATRKVPNNRAYISGKQREETGAVDLQLQSRRCTNVNFLINPCPEDALNALKNELRFTFEGLPSADNLRPSLAQQAQTTSFHDLGFEINCGTDNKCVDNLKVDFNFTESSEVRVGIDELLNVTISVENTEENSYNSRVILTYPVGLSYRKFTSLQGRIECQSLDSEDGVTRGNTECTIDKPIFASNAKSFFIVSYGIDTNSQLERRIFLTANATSGNQEHSSSSKLYKMRAIDVKYSILVTIQSSLSYVNFTFGDSNLQKPVQQSIEVLNDIRALNFTVVIKVPVKLGSKDIWMDVNNLTIPSCQRDNDKEPTVKDFIPEIQKNKLVNCSVATCAVFKCTRFMTRLETKKYEISGNLSSGWIEQIGLQSAKFYLTSEASLDYDKSQYIFFSAESKNNPPVRKIVAEVEVYAEPDFTKEIAGGSLGGLALLVLLAAGLYKAGFFKSKYKNMINEDAAQGEGPDAAGDAPE